VGLDQLGFDLVEIERRGSSTRAPGGARATISAGTSDPAYKQTGQRATRRDRAR
jgi:hypothetical protein